MLEKTALRPAVAAVWITDKLESRQISTPDSDSEKTALAELASHMANDPAGLLPRLVQQALVFCNADSAGVSVLEGEVFRWEGLTGTLKTFEGAFTPRNNSPCGACLDHRGPVLMAYPEKAYDWISDAKITVPEVLLVPLYVNGEQPLGTLWVVAREGSQFNKGHARILMELAKFTGIALHMTQSDARLKAALVHQETLTAEMSHRVKNLLATTSALVQLSSRGSATKEDMTHSLMGRLQALGAAHALVRSEFGPGQETKSVALDDLLNAVVSPYASPSLDGPAVALGEHATNAVALVFHELTTNAAKYGALSTAGGKVSVRWTVTDGALALDWNETGGRLRAPDAPSGFGSKLVEGTISGLGGTIAHDWRPTGLVATITVPTERLGR